MNMKWRNEMDNHHEAIDFSKIRIEEFNKSIQSHYSHIDNHSARTRQELHEMFRQHKQDSNIYKEGITRN